MRIALIVSIIAHVLFVTFSARDLRPTSHGETMTVDLVPANEAPAVSAAPKSDPSATQSKEAKPEPKVGQPSTTQAAKAESMPSEAKAPDAKPPEAKAAQAKPAPTAAMTKPAEQKPQPPQQFPNEQNPPQPSQTATQPPAPDPHQTGPREMPPDMNRLAEMLGPADRGGGNVRHDGRAHEQVHGRRQGVQGTGEEMSDAATRHRSQSADEDGHPGRAHAPRCARAGSEP